MRWETCKICRNNIVIENTVKSFLTKYNENIISYLPFWIVFLAQRQYIIRLNPTFYRFNTRKNHKQNNFQLIINLHIWSPQNYLYVKQKQNWKQNFILKENPQKIGNTETLCVPSKGFVQHWYWEKYTFFCRCFNVFLPTVYPELCKARTKSIKDGTK